MKRILFFIESLSGGGAEKVLVTLLHHLDKTRYDVTVLTLTDTGVFRKQIDASQIHCCSAIHSSKHPVRSFLNKVKYKLIYQVLPVSWAARWLVPKRGFDVYIAFSEGFATKIISCMEGARIAWVHINLEAYPWTLQKHVYKCLEEEKSAYMRFDRIVCVSDSVERAMRRRYGLHNTVTVLNPVDTEEILSLSQAGGEIVPVRPGFQMVSVGRLDWQKGYDRLIPIIRRLRDKGLNVSLIIIGEGKERFALERQIAREGLQQSVYLPGFLENPYAILHQMDLFVCSSRAEGYSLAIAEAMILGLPVVSTNCSGPDILLDGGKYGALCDNDESLYATLLQAVSNPAFLSGLREKSLARRDFFRMERTMQQITSILEQVSNNADCQHHHPRL